jgi:5'-3' exonuclease
MTHRPKSIALVDISYLFKKHWHLPANKDVRLAAAHGALRDLESLGTSQGQERPAEHIIVCCDWGPYKRTEVFAEYKANRPEREPEELQQLRYLMDELKRRGYPIARVQGYEADDVIATLAKKYSEWCPDVRLVGPDKDISQCITERVRQFIPSSGEREWEIRDGAGVLSKFGVYPARMPMYQALVGDSSDNIPGVDKVGPKTAMEIVNQYHTPTKLAEALPTLSLRSVRNPDAIKASLIVNWENFILSLKLVTLDTSVPLDAEALLTHREEQPAREPLVEMGLAQDEFVIERNATPLSPPPANDHDEALADAVKAYQEKLPELQKAARSAESEEHYEAERRANEEHVEPATPRIPMRPPVKAVPRESSIITVPSYTQTKHGLVTKDLQPLDLDAAITLSKWFAEGGLYVRKFKNAGQIFTIIAKARELGLPVTVVLENYHIIEGQPRPSADLIRALAERDPNFEYLMPVEMTATRCVWEGKHKRQPRPVQYAYTAEEAQAAGLFRKGPNGPNNWFTRTQDMLNKTAASKLARILWPASTMGLYCMEEMGYDAADLEAA